MNWVDLGLFFEQTEYVEFYTNVPMIIAMIGCLILGYFLGGINTGIIVSKIVYHDDIRNYGSKNAGMTNMLRTYGKKMAAITLLGDILKAVIAIFAARLILGTWGAYIAGLGCVIGHVFPCYFGFKGGKGVATVAAMVLCTNPFLFLILFAVFAILVIGYKFVSLGSVMCMMLYPVFISRLGSHMEKHIIPIFCVFAVAVLVIVKHKDNIKRLLAGTENKISLKKKKEETEEK